MRFIGKGVNNATFPEAPPGWVGIDYLIARRRLASYSASMLLIGTGCNIIVALIGVAAGKWIIVL